MARVSLKSYTNKLSNLVRSFPVGHVFVIDSPEFTFVKELCGVVGGAYSKVLERSSLKISVGTQETKYSNGPYKVIMLFSDSESNPGTITELPLTKTIVTKSLTKLNGQEQSDGEINRTKVLEIMRLLIKPQVDEFRLTWRNKVAIAKSNNDKVEYALLVTCPITGKDLTRCNIHVDHLIPFSYLAKDFLSKNKVDPFLVEIITGKNPRFADPFLNDEWINYHKLYANLQILEAKANIAKQDKMDEISRARLNHVEKRRPRAG